MNTPDDKIYKYILVAFVCSLTFLLFSWRSENRVKNLELEVKINRVMCGELAEKLHHQSEVVLIQSSAILKNYQLTKSFINIYDKGERNIRDVGRKDKWGKF
jgi:hypothetical protein